MVALSIFIIFLGGWFLISALANWDWYNAILDFAAVEALFGESASRWLCGVVGLVLIGGGVAGAISTR